MHKHADSKGQPAPTGNGQPVAVELVHDLLDRREVGIAKYSQELKTGNGRRALVDAYQEVLDLAMYLKQALMEEDAKIENTVDLSKLFTKAEIAVLISFAEARSVMSPKNHDIYYKLCTIHLQMA